MSDKQDAFVKAIGTEFPNTPHRYCHNHFLRDVAKPVLDAGRVSVELMGLVKPLRCTQESEGDQLN